jgi:hypothetical protein
VDESEIDEAAITAVIEPTNCLAGLVCPLRCVEVKTRDGNPFTKHFWEAGADDAA